MTRILTDDVVGLLGPRVGVSGQRKEEVDQTVSQPAFRKAGWEGGAGEYAVSGHYRWL